MTDYVKATDFASKDALLSGNPAKVIKGTEIDTEYNAIAVAVATKADLVSPTFTGTPLAPTAASGTNTTQIATTAYVVAERTATATLTNKTISADNNTLSGIAASSFVLSNASGNIDGSAAQKAIPSGDVVGTTDTQTLTNKTFTGFTETVYAISDGSSVDLNPSNGTIQTWTLGANRSPTASSFAAGQSMTLMVNDGTAYTITWPSVTWVGGSAPTLATSGYTVIVLWKVGTTLYGTSIGSVA